MISVLHEDDLAMAEQTEKTTLSTRVSSGDKELIERAAESRGWSPAKFVRIAALEKAKQALNIESQDTESLRRLAERIVTHLKNPGANVKYVLRGFDREVESGIFKATYAEPATQYDDGDPRDYTYEEVHLVRPELRDMTDFRDALRHFGMDFAEIFKAEFDAYPRSSISISPKYSVDEPVSEDEE